MKRVMIQRLRNFRRLRRGGWNPAPASGCLADGEGFSSVGEVAERRLSVCRGVWRVPAVGMLLLSLSCGGCGVRPEGDFAVNSFLAEEHPDSARMLLRAMDTERMEPRRMAQWRLMMGLAEAAAGDTLECRRRVDRAMGYFDRHGSPGERAEAWYLYAKVCVRLGDREQAIRGYTQSAILTEETLARGGEAMPRRKRLGLLLAVVYHTLGVLYFEQGYDAVEPFAKAVETARANGNAEQEGYSRFMLASAHCAAGDYRKAIETLGPLVEAADTIPFRYFAQQIRLQNLIFHTYLGDWTPEQMLAARGDIDLGEIRRASLSYGQAVSEDTERSFYAVSEDTERSFYAVSEDTERSFYDVASAIIFQRDGQLDSARYYIERSLECRETFHQGDVGLFDLAAGIYHDRGDDARAYDFMQRYVAVKDSLAEVQRGAQVAELERRYRTANEVALREASLRYRTWIAMLVAVLVVMAAGWAVAGYRRKLRRRDGQVNELLALLDSYRESHDSLTSRLDASDAREAAVKRLLEGRVAAVRDIAATYYLYGEGERLAAKMREMVLSPAMLADVVGMADLYSDRAVTRLREQCPGWTARNYDFAALVIAGFSPQEICVMLGMSLNGVYTLKSKLKRRIAESQAPDRELLLRLFL